MPKYERKAFSHPKYLDLSIKSKDKFGRTVYAIQASNFRRDDIKDEPPKTYSKWNTIRINENIALKYSTAIRNTNFVLQGEKVTFLIFKDGRKIRLHFQEISRRIGAKIGAEMKKIYTIPIVEKGQSGTTSGTAIKHDRRRPRPSV